MEKNGNPPSYGWSNGHMQAPPAAPPSYSQAVGGVGPSSPYTPQYPRTTGPQIVTTVVPLGPQSTHMICPSCHGEIDTASKKKPGLIAYIAGSVMCILGLFCGCCLIPCCIDSCMDVHHECPNCGAHLGRYRRSKHLRVSKLILSSLIILYNCCNLTRQSAQELCIGQRFWRLFLTQC